MSRVDIFVIHDDLEKKCGVLQEESQSGLHSCTMLAWLHLGLSHASQDCCGTYQRAHADLGCLPRPHQGDVIPETSWPARLPRALQSWQRRTRNMILGI